MDKDITDHFPSLVAAGRGPQRGERHRLSLWPAFRMFERPFWWLRGEPYTSSAIMAFKTLAPQTAVCRAEEIGGEVCVARGAVSSARRRDICQAPVGTVFSPKLDKTWRALRLCYGGERRG